MSTPSAAVAIWRHSAKPSNGGESMMTRSYSLVNSSRRGESRGPMRSAARWEPGPAGSRVRFGFPSIGQNHFLPEHLARQHIGESDARRESEFRVKAGTPKIAVHQQRLLAPIGIGDRKVGGDGCFALRRGGARQGDRAKTSLEVGKRMVLRIVRTASSKSGGCSIVSLADWGLKLPLRGLPPTAPARSGLGSWAADLVNRHGPDDIHSEEPAGLLGIAKRRVDRVQKHSSTDPQERRNEKRHHEIHLYIGINRMQWRPCRIGNAYVVILKACIDVRFLDLLYQFIV